MISAVSQQLKDELAPIIGDVKIKNLFAGYGIFYSEMMFAIYQMVVYILERRMN